MDVAHLMERFSDFVWSTPTAVLLTGAGLLFTLALLLPQWRVLTHGISVIRGKYDNPEDEGNISHFQALCAALSATIGLGNIAGVGVAVAAGGPGAVFWMWICGLVGMATKFTTCSLAVMHRHTDSFGTLRGGPMYYIELGLGRVWKPLAVLFALLGAMASFGAGNMFQANQTCDIIYGLVHTHFPTVTPWPVKFTVGLALVLLASLVIIGGIKRIGAVASKLVPSMCVIYVSGALIVIGLHISEVPGLLWTIVHDAFSGTAATGAFFGVATREAIKQGIKRACFSNEAGLGSAPMAHATAKTKESIREGVVAGIGPFVDTVVICTMTALVILITGAHARGPVGTVAGIAEPRLVTSVEGPNVREVTLTLAVTDQANATVGDDYFVRATPGETDEEPALVSFRLGRQDDKPWVAVVTYADTPEGRAQMEADQAALQVGQAFYLDREGIRLTAYAFDQQLKGFGTYFIPLAAFLFAFSTMISWSFYGETCTEYLFGEKALMPFRFVFVAMIMVGSLFGLDPVIDWSDAMLGLMLVPNLIGTIALLGHVMRAGGDYFRKLDAGEFQEQVERAAAYRASKKGRRYR